MLKAVLTPLSNIKKPQKRSDKVVYFYLFLFLSEERVRVAKRKSSEYSKWANVEVRKRKAQKIICVSRGSYS